MPEINYCLNNITPQVRDLLRASGLHVIEDICLGRCGDCYESPFLIIDGKLVSGCSHEQILRSIHERTLHLHR